MCVCACVNTWREMQHFYVNGSKRICGFVKLEPLQSGQQREWLNKYRDAKASLAASDFTEGAFPAGEDSDRLGD